MHIVQVLSRPSLLGLSLCFHGPLVWGEWGRLFSVPFPMGAVVFLHSTYLFTQNKKKGNPN